MALQIIRTVGLISPASPRCEHWGKSPVNPHSSTLIQCPSYAVARLTVKSLGSGVYANNYCQTHAKEIKEQAEAGKLEILGSETFKTVKVQLAEIEDEVEQ